MMRPNPSDGGSCGRAGKSVAGAAPEHSSDSRTDAILGVFQELGLDDPEVSELMKRLAEGWGSQEASSEPRVVIRGDTAVDD